MHRRSSLATLIALFALAGSLCQAAPVAPAVTEVGGDLQVTLAGNVTLRFAREGDWLLGLNQARVDSLALTSPDTCYRPVLAQQWGKNPKAWPLMKLHHTEVIDGAVHIRVQLYQADDEQTFRDIYVFAGDRKRALAEGMTPQLKQLQADAQAAWKTLDAAIAEQDAYKKQQAQVDKWLKRAQDEPKKRDWLLTRADRARQKLAGVRANLARKLAGTDPGLKAAYARVQTFESALDERALELGKIHRDYYRMPHLRQPAQVCTVDFLRNQVKRLAPKAKQAGSLTWVLTPTSANVAGWVWSGWTQHVEFQLDNEKLNVVRHLGTWELGGNLDGLTVVNLRYRGLGRIEQPLTTDEGAVNEAFTTTEIMPGAVGGAPLISPVVPPSTSVNDRGYALRHRAGAWICRMARGAGHGYVDFQFRPTAAMACFPVRQGNHRALTETFPGDTVLSQTDEEFFPLTDKGKTTPMAYLVLATPDEPLSIHESRTRWQEMDQHVRDRVSEELGFVQYPPLPGVGILSDAGWAGYYKSLAGGALKAWADQGVRLVAYHNPGWVNGRHQGPEGPKNTGGGVCNIYDWWPTTEVVEPWRDFQRACAANRVAFYPWLGQTQWRDAPFAKRVGYDKECWSLNGPEDAFGPGYGYENVKGNIENETFRKAFTGQLAKLHQEVGYQGFWCDSFQNLFMTQLNWAEGTGNSLQRAWWEQISAWSRDGIGWMAESHSFPGMSCSIEVQNWEKDVAYFQHVWKWLRGNEQSHYKPEQLDALCFAVMARKGWLAPDHSYKTHDKFAIPSFKRLAHEYLAALPGMVRSYELPDGKGVLWLGPNGNDEGVLFAIQAMDLPDAVISRPILARETSQVVKAQHTYRVRAKDLLEAFSLRAGPAKDPRVGQQHEIPRYTWPVKGE